MSVRSCEKCQLGTKVMIVNHVLAGLTGTVIAIDQYGQIDIDIDDVDCSPVSVRQQHLKRLDG